MALHWTGRKTAGSVWSAFKRRRQIITMQSSWTSACPLWTAIRLPGPDAREIPIIAMTADAFSEDIRRAMDSGMSAHIAKPIDIRELLRVLQRCLS